MNKRRIWVVLIMERTKGPFPSIIDHAAFLTAHDAHHFENTSMNDYSDDLYDATTNPRGKIDIQTIMTEG